MQYLEKCYTKVYLEKCYTRGLFVIIIKLNILIKTGFGELENVPKNCVTLRNCYDNSDVSK